tara:strand:- start:529 stop:732 length:204 start_codon:yes stop_codon:yes gene_type:complete
MVREKQARYEVFNTTTGKWEVAYLKETELNDARVAFENDWQLYEAEKRIVEAIIDQICNPSEHKRGD